MDNSNQKKYSKVKSKVKSFKTTVDAKQKEFKNFKDNAGNNFDANYAKTFKNLNEWGDSVDGQIQQKKKQSQDKIKNQLDELIEVFMISDVQKNKSSYQTVDTLIDIYNNTILNTKTKITELFIKESIKTIGCSEEQEFTPSPLYINIKALDLFSLLKNDPSG